MKDKKLNLDRRQPSTGVAAVVAPAVLITPAFAITPDEIKKRGKVTSAFRVTTRRGGYVNSSGKQQGLNSDIGQLYGKYLGVPVEFLPLEVANRIPALTSARRHPLRHDGNVPPTEQRRCSSASLCREHHSSHRAQVDKIKSNADMAKLEKHRRRTRSRAGYASD